MTDANPAAADRATDQNEPDSDGEERSQADAGSGPGAPQSTDEDSAAEPGSGPGAPAR